MTTCSTCKNWAPKNDKPMARFRLAACLLGPIWQYKPPQGTCQSYKPAGADVIEQRRAWLEKAV